MKFALLALPLLAVTAASFAADNDAAPVAVEAAAKLTLDSPIEALMANEKAKMILDANLPGIASHPSYAMFKAMSLRDVQPFSQGMITDDMLAKIAVGLAFIK